MVQPIRKSRKRSPQSPCFRTRSIDTSKIGTHTSVRVVTVKVSFLTVSTIGKPMFKKTMTNPNHYMTKVLTIQDVKRRKPKRAALKHRLLKSNKLIREERPSLRSKKRPRSQHIIAVLLRMITKNLVMETQIIAIHNRFQMLNHRRQSRSRAKTRKEMSLTS